MKRTIVNIDEEKCTGCGLCIPNCHEGALQIIDGKVRLISDLFCDGLGACLGHCPESAITLEEREAESYNETKAMELMVKKGRNTVLAHLDHLREHNENELLRKAIVYIKSNNIDMSTNFENSPMIKAEAIQNFGKKTGCSGGCPGSMAMDFRKDMEKVEDAGKNAPTPSELRQWPVQLHLLNPQASYFKNADVVFAADCTAFAMGNFHQDYLKGKNLAIACPKLDSNKESYIEKIAAMISISQINTLTVMIIEVPCCSGLMQIVQLALLKAERKIPVKRIIVSIQGEVLEEEWL